MSYLRQAHARIVIGAFAVCSLLFVAFPRIDIAFSALFFDNGFRLIDKGWQDWLHDALAFCIATSLLGAVAIYAFNRLKKRAVLNLDGRRVAYLILVLVVGAGLIVNLGFKDHFGRARPRAVAEFNGSKQFTPAFTVSKQCDRNCSFSSGDGAGAFISLAFAFALTRRRAALVAAVVFGSAVSLLRVASGAHFLSDIVVSFFTMLLVADILRHYMFAFAPRPAVRMPSIGVAAGTP